MRGRAYAKINLCLDVVGKREDGYHELRMVMVPINFYDMLEMIPAQETSMELNRSYLPLDEKNTVLKAIKIMQETYNIDHGYECHLIKHIPTQAGLAGGSADAACAIRMINRMEHLYLSDEELIDIAKQVGSDVPFCVLNKPALVEGTGEKITTFEFDPNFHVLLVKPRRGVSTRVAFGNIDFETVEHPDCDAMVKALQQNDYLGIVDNLGNSLEKVSLKLVRDIREVKKDLEAYGFDGVLMSGSGSTVFGITQNKDLLERAANIMKSKGYFVRITSVLKPRNY